jgi:hypothetical protein
MKIEIAVLGSGYKSGERDGVFEEVELFKKLAWTSVLPSGHLETLDPDTRSSTSCVFNEPSELMVKINDFVATLVNGKVDNVIGDHRLICVMKGENHNQIIFYDGCRRNACKIVLSVDVPYEFGDGDVRFMSTMRVIVIMSDEGYDSTAASENLAWYHTDYPGGSPKAVSVVSGSRLGATIPRMGREIEPVFFSQIDEICKRYVSKSRDLTVWKDFPHAEVLQASYMFLRSFLLANDPKTSLSSFDQIVIVGITKTSSYNGRVASTSGWRPAFSIKIDYVDKSLVKFDGDNYEQECSRVGAYVCLSDVEYSWSVRDPVQKLH